MTPQPSRQRPAQARVERHWSEDDSPMFSPLLVGMTVAFFGAIALLSQLRTDGLALPF